MAGPTPTWFRVDPASGHYIEPRASLRYRPIAQGDVFKGIPFPIPKHPSPAGNERRQPGFWKTPLQEQLPVPDPNQQKDSLRLKTRMGMLLPHTCEYYETEAGPRNPIRVLALVRERKAEVIPEDWNGAFSLFPLPNLLGDGLYYLAQLDTVVTVEEAYLAKDSRVACLSFDGWLALQQRLAQFFARMHAPWEELDALQRPTWQTVEDDEVRLADAGSVSSW